MTSLPINIFFVRKGTYISIISSLMSNINLIYLISGASDNIHLPDLPRPYDPIYDIHLLQSTGN